ncbi:MAG: orotate phosphoribosyltransferase [Thermogemmata sp.]|nr:orotate phosphoribosyltransferase [Thermogemmata sp.]
MSALVRQSKKALPGIQPLQGPVVGQNTRDFSGVTLPRELITPMEAYERLRELISQRAIQYGDFTLASGRKSWYYINSKQVLFHSEAVALLGECLYHFSADVEFDAIGGMETGAIPMTVAALVAYHQRGQQREGFYVRKQAKEHGSRQRVEGRVGPGQRVVIVDDVLTTGASARQAIEAVEGLGARVVRVIALVDREEGAAETLKEYEVRPLFTIRQLQVPIAPARHG